MYPYLDRQGFKRRTTMPAGEVDYIKTQAPGYIEQRIAVRSSYINSRLRKRYGGSLPFGMSPPEVIGPTPGITLTGTPTLGSIQLQIEIETGAATFRFSLDGGVTWAGSGIAIGSNVLLGSSGMTAQFAGAYAAGALYTAAPPVPEAVLGWVTILVTWDCYRKRGINPQDPAIELLKEDVTTALAELKEAADSKDGLFDLPFSEDETSAITTAGPQGYSETSPYVGFDIEAAEGYSEDNNEFTPFAEGGSANGGRCGTRRGCFVTYQSVAAATNLAGFPLSLNQQRLVALADPKDPQDAVNLRSIQTLLAVTGQVTASGVVTVRTSDVFIGLIGSGQIIELPATPPLFWAVRIKDQSGNAHLAPVTVDGGGNPIEIFGQAGAYSTSPTTIDEAGFGYTIVWNGSEYVFAS